MFDYTVFLKHLIKVMPIEDLHLIKVGILFSPTGIEDGITAIRVAVPFADIIYYIFHHIKYWTKCLRSSLNQ